MYRVLIVDDEPYVVEWLSEMLESRTEPELDVCRAYSAAEALGWLSRTKIDILVTDIRMPEMSGIALAEKVKMSWPQCKIIFLTAYDEFDYAYNAIKNNIIGYILKTEDDEYILAVVDKAISMLDKEMQNLELIGQVQDQLKSSLSVIRKEIIISLLKEDYDNPSELFKQLENIGSDITAEKPFIMFIGRIENIPYKLNIVEKFRQFNSVQKIVEQYFGAYFYCDSVEYTFNKIVWIMQVKEDECPEPEENTAIVGREIVFSEGMLETVQHSCKDTADICISFVLHRVLFDTELLPEIFQSLDRLLNLHTADNAGFIITDMVSALVVDAINEGAFTGTYCISNIIEKLKIFLEDNRKEEFMIELEKICVEIESSTSWYDNTALENYYSTAVSIISYINERKIADKIALKIGLNGLFRPQSAGSWSNAAVYLRHISEILFELQKDDEGWLSNSIVNFLRKYICEHMAEDVSLVRLSEVSGYNTKYLSRFFSETAGETLNDYIGRQKINKIKELMNDKSLSISDIASQTGFNYRTYFNKFVKKTTGLSPQELREHI